MSTNSSAEILNPNRQLVVSSVGRRIEVHELSWLHLKKLLAAIAAKLNSVSSLMGADGGAQSISLERVTQLITDSEELVEAVLGHTTDLTFEEIGVLSLTEIFTVLDVALDLNITSLGAGTKKAFGRITSFAVKRPSSPATSTETPTATSA